MCSPVVGTRGIACTNSWEDCAIVTAVELGPFVHVRHGGSGFGGIGACASSGIVSASWNVSLASESSSESVTKAVSLAKKTVGLGLYPSWVSVAKAFLVKA